MDLLQLVERSVIGSAPAAAGRWPSAGGGASPPCSGQPAGRERPPGPGGWARPDCPASREDSPRPRGPQHATAGGHGMLRSEQGSEVRQVRLERGRMGRSGQNGVVRPSKAGRDG